MSGMDAMVMYGRNKGGTTRSPGCWCLVMGALARRALVRSERLTSTPAELGRAAGEVCLAFASPGCS